MIGIVIAIALAVAGPAQADRDARQKVIKQRPFGPVSIWSGPVDAGAPLSSLSQQYVDRLGSTVARYGAWLNTHEWSAPVYKVPAGQPNVSVAMPAHVRPDIQASFAQVPLPPQARPSPDNDSHLVVWQPSTDTLWELFEAERRQGRWTAAYGGRMTAVSRNPGYFTAGGATATGLPLLGGLIRISELRAGVIPHALSLALPEPRADWYAWPAQRTDGTSADPLAIPEGTRFRLDPALDLSKLDLPPVTRTIARAAQRYGIYITDRGGAVAFEAEDPAPRARNPYPKLYGGLTPDQLLASFPWSRLQAVDAQLSCC